MSSALALLLQILELAGTLVLVTAAGILLWLALSPFAYALLRVSEALGLTFAFHWARSKLLSLNPLAVWRSSFASRPKVAGFLSSEVSVVIDERLTVLQEAIRRTLDTMGGASGTLLALVGAKGTEAVASDIRSVQERVEQLAELGGEIPEDIVDDYRVRARSVFAIFLLVALLAAVSLANGFVLSLFFKDLVFGHIAGVRSSYIVAIVIILGEAGIGAMAYHFRANIIAKAIFFAALGLAALFEAIIFGIMSYGFDLNIPLFDDHPALKLWLSLLGIVLVTMTGGVGFALHGSIDEVLDRVGAKRLKDEIRTLNSLLRDLPARWESIRLKADSAAASMTNFQSALGGRKGALAGAVDKIAAERRAIQKALTDARVDSWPQAIEGRTADSLRKNFQQVALGVISVLGVAAFAFALDLVLGRAFRGWHSLALLAGSSMCAAAYYVVGWLSFGRIQLLGERVFPLRAGRRETAMAALASTAASVAIIVACLQIGGTSGVAYGLLLVAGGAVLGLLGYFFDDAVRGIASACAGGVGVILGLAAGLSVVVAHAIGWPVLGLAGVIWLLLSFVAWPLERVILPRFSRDAPQAAPRPRGRRLQRVA